MKDLLTLSPPLAIESAKVHRSSPSMDDKETVGEREVEWVLEIQKAVPLWRHIPARAGLLRTPRFPRSRKLRTLNLYLPAAAHAVCPQTP